MQYFDAIAYLAHAVNLEYVRRIVGHSQVRGGGVVCRVPHGVPLGEGFRAVPVKDLEG